MIEVKNKSILIIGGAGFLGHALVKRFIDNNAVYVFSRDEAKHFYLKQKFPKVNCIVGDIRDYQALFNAIRNTHPHIIINAAALKQVPLCEDQPFEAIKTNVLGTQNLVQAVENYFGIEDAGIKVLSVSTDKSCKPVNSYGMCKALQERLHLRGLGQQFCVVRYGNVLNSTGSVIPFFIQRIKAGKTLPITDISMTRFLISDTKAVDLICQALDRSEKNIYIPKIKSCFIFELAEILCNYYSYDIKNIEYLYKIRPGEKLNEILISEEECRRTQEKDNMYIIHDLYETGSYNHINKEYSSGDNGVIMSREELNQYLLDNGILE